MLGTTALVEVRNLSKLYARSPTVTRRRAARVFTKVLTGRRSHQIGRLNTSEFWALKDVSFQLDRGEALGIVGLNGSGKTTLLRILAGQLLPDAGEVVLRGDVAALIDATAGFRKTASGRENIFLRSAMLGRSPKEVEASFDEIVEFTELGEAINSPIATYSSGMVMRLAFAINTAAAPDVLLIDETLSVGDFKFRQKCLARLRELRDRCCFILVSHSMSDIRRFCTRALVLDHGQLAYSGTPDESIRFYESLVSGAQSHDDRRETVLKPWFQNSASVVDLEHFWCDATGKPVDTVVTGESLYLHVAFTLAHAPRHLIMGVPVWSESGDYVTGFSTEVEDDRFSIEPGVRTAFRLEVPSLPLNAGNYISNFGLTDGPEFLVRSANPPLTVLGNGRPHWGLLSVPHKWRLVGQSTSPAWANHME